MDMLADIDRVPSGNSGGLTWWVVVLGWFWCVRVPGGFRLLCIFPMFLEKTQGVGCCIRRFAQVREVFFFTPVFL